MLLINPPSVLSPGGAANTANREGTASFGGLSTGFAYPPHTLATTAAACREAGLRVHVLDCVGDNLDLETFLTRVRNFGPRLLGVYCSWGTLDADRASLAALRAELPDTPIIALGASTRFCADELLAAGATHVLIGDPDIAFAKLVQGPLPPPGLVKVRDLLPAEHNHSGLLREGVPVPRPAWDLAPWQHYGFLTLFSTRGCNDTCKFCAYVTVQGRSLRVRPEDDVVDEMLWLARSFQPRRILVRDPVFAAERTRAMSIARKLRAAGFRTRWECESRPEHFDPALLEALALAGCNVIKIGIETTNPELLTQIGRVEHPSEAAHYLAYAGRMVDEARRVGIATRAFVMVGLPGQTLADAEATAEYLRTIRPTYVHVRPYVAFPRVPLGEALVESKTEALAAPLQAAADALNLRSSARPALSYRLKTTAAGLGRRLPGKKART